MLGGKVKLSLPKWRGGLGLAIKQQFAGAGNARRYGVAAVVALLVIGGYFASRRLPASVTSLAGLNPFAAKIVEGKAMATGGDIIRINGAVIRLSGIEAPEADQKCVGANKKKWACGEAASGALQRIIKGKTVRCEVSGADSAGRPFGVCQTVNTGSSQDVAAALVKEGAVFADAGLFASYTSLEAEAQAKKLGLWKGEADRPADYRNKAWETAAKAAPDGCPIKGQVAGDSKTYVMPWSPSYDGARVRTGRGERWFCSETEAQAAGWKMAAR
jgi:endonuclease YncB( thermonuclease family)